MTLAEVRPIDAASADEVLGLAAAVESGSEHPIARAVVAGARERGLDDPAASEHRVTPGAGASALVEGATVEVTRPEDLGRDADAIVEELASGGATPFVVRRGGVPIGVVGVVDRVKPDAGPAIARLHAMGIHVAMVTGDRPATADAVARQVGIDDVTAEVDPVEKVEAVDRAHGVGARRGVRR